MPSVPVVDGSAEGEASFKKYIVMTGDSKQFLRYMKCFAKFLVLTVDDRSCRTISAYFYDKEDAMANRRTPDMYYSGDQ